MATDVVEPVAPQINRFVTCVDIYGVIEDETGTSQVVPGYTIVHGYTNFDDKVFYGILDEDERYLSRNGDWNEDVGDAGFERAHYFLYEEAVARAGFAIMNKSQKPSATRIVQDVVNEILRLKDNQIIQDVYILRNPEFGFSVDYKGRFLSKAGNWHRYGTTERFNRNHYFPHEDAIARAEAFLREVAREETASQSEMLRTNLAYNPDFVSTLVTFNPSN